jgi:glycosyltransferase involved in cell wall biosynthesis
MNLRDVSVIVTTYNEEHNVARCLGSARGFGEVIVVDSFSTDETLEIARGFGATVFVRPYVSASRQKNWALDVARNDWVLILDADEVLTEELLEEIIRLEDGHADGYWIRRRSVYLGRAIRGCGWQRDKVLRLFDRRHGRYSDTAVHEEVVVDGHKEILEGRFLHYPYRDVGQHLRKINEYSARGARDYTERGGRMALWNMIVHPPARVVRMYLLQRGFLDGREGLILCLLSAYGVFLKYAKAWESGWRRRS